MDNVILNNGVEMSLIGMGTFPLNGLKFGLLIRKAVRIGHTSFDTSSAYGNEKWLGRGIRFSGKKREHLFVTSKLSNGDQRKGDIRKALLDSLSRMGLDYLDLYLMHWPNPETYLDSWKQMESLYREGLVRAIGVSNFHQHHLERLLEVATVTPAVNQVELHPLLSQKPLVDFCSTAGIQMQSYSPFARMHEKLIRNKILVSIARDVNKSVPQVILRWNYQNKIISVPKASSPIHLKENLSIRDFTLSETAMTLINDQNIDFRVRHNPDNCDFSKL